MAKKDKHIKKILQKAQPETVSSNFTQKVMSKVEAHSKELVLEDPKLKRYLQFAGLEQPEQGFQARVLAGIVQNKYKPIISTPAWLAILSSVAALIIYTMFYGTDRSDTDNIISKSITEVTGLLTQIQVPIFESSQITSILIISVFGLFSLVFFDFIIRAKKLQI